MERGSRSRSHRYANPLEDSRRYFDMEPELALDPAAGACSSRNHSISLHVVSEGMRTASADGCWMGGGRCGHEDAPDQPWSFVSAGLWSTPAELASATAARSAAPR